MRGLKVIHVPYRHLQFVMSVGGGGRRREEIGGGEGMDSGRELTEYLTDCE